MKKKRFYNNVERDTKWTEEEKGRPIDFADKYVYNGDYFDKYDYLRPKKKEKKKISKDAVKKNLKRLGAVLIAFVIIGVGYTAMDIYMIRTGIPPMQEAREESAQTDLSSMDLTVNGLYTDSVSLDGGVMLSAVNDKATAGGCNAVAFDIKRSDGSIGYKSSLSVVDTYGAIVFPAANLKSSANKLKEQDILTVGRVYCYLDNTVPAKDPNLTIYSASGAIYRDSKDNTYLNPNADGTYSYIKDIIAEAYSMGVNVFVLDGYDLPSDISDGYNDGFDYIAQKLYNDLGKGIKLLKAENVRITQNDIDSENADEIISQKFNSEADKNTVYFITSPIDGETLKEKSEEWGITSYILAQ